MAPLLLEPIGPFIIITVYFLPAVVANRGQAEHEISFFGLTYCWGGPCSAGWRCFFGLWPRQNPGPFRKVGYPIIFGNAQLLRASVIDP